MRVFIFSLLAVFVFSSCEFYESKVPLVSEKKAIKADDMLGKWYLYGEEGYGDFYPSLSIEVTPKSKNTYQFLTTFYKKNRPEKDEKLLMTGCKVKLQNEEVVQVKYLEKRDNEEVFMFFKYNSLDKDKAQLSYLNKSYPQSFTSTKSFYKHVKSDMRIFNQNFKEMKGTFYKQEALTWNVINFSFPIDKIKKAWAMDSTYTMSQILNFYEENKIHEKGKEVSPELVMLLISKYHISDVLLPLDVQIDVSYLIDYGVSDNILAEPRIKHIQLLNSGQYLKDMTSGLIYQKAK